MFNEKELRILKALVEDELYKLMTSCPSEEDEILLNSYNQTLSKVLVKMDVETVDNFSAIKGADLMEELSNRQDI
jgi:hypothetical protein